MRLLLVAPPGLIAGPGAQRRRKLPRRRASLLRRLRRPSVRCQQQLSPRRDRRTADSRRFDGRGCGDAARG